MSDTALLKTQHGIIIKLKSSEIQIMWHDIKYIHWRYPEKNLFSTVPSPLMTFNTSVILYLYLLLKHNVHLVLWTECTHKLTKFYKQNTTHSYNFHKRSLFLLSKFAKIIWHETTINVPNTWTWNPFNATTTLPDL